MAIDIVTIWNQALSAAGSRSTISALDEQGKEANLCRLWYPVVRHNTLKAADWASARKFAQLALLATRDFGVAWTITDPAPTWKYAYAVPVDMLAPRYLTSYARFDRSLLGAANALHTQQELAVLHYLADQEDVTLWDTGLESAVIHSLAAQLVMPLFAKVTRAEAQRELAVEQVLLAQTEMANESDDLQDELPTWISARGYEELPRQTRFVYPYETLLGIAS